MGSTHASPSSQFRPSSQKNTPIRRRIGGLLYSQVGAKQKMVTRHLRIHHYSTMILVFYSPPHWHLGYFRIFSRKIHARLDIELHIGAKYKHTTRTCPIGKKVHTLLRTIAQRKTELQRNIPRDTSKIKRTHTWLASQKLPTGKQRRIGPKIIPRNRCRQHGSAVAIVLGPLKKRSPILLDAHP